MARTDHDQRQSRDPAAPASRHAARGRGRIAAAISVFGELLITAGLVLGLFVAYSLWWTNVLADREANKQGDQVRNALGRRRGRARSTPRTASASCTCRP